jgi:hypothetical protein
MGIPFLVSQYMVAVVSDTNRCLINTVVRDKIRGTVWTSHRKIFFSVYYLLLIHMFLEVISSSGCSENYIFSKLKTQREI